MESGQPWQWVIRERSTHGIMANCLNNNNVIETISCFDAKKFNSKRNAIRSLLKHYPNAKRVTNQRTRKLTGYSVTEHDMIEKEKRICQ